MQSYLLLAAMLIFLAYLTVLETKSYLLNRRARKLTHAEKCTLNDMLTSPVRYDVKNPSHSKLLNLKFVVRRNRHLRLTNDGTKVGYSLTAANFTCPL